MTGMARERALAELVDMIESVASLHWRGRYTDAGEMLDAARDTAATLGLPTRGGQPGT